MNDVRSTWSKSRMISFMAECETRIGILEHENREMQEILDGLVNQIYDDDGEGESIAILNKTITERLHVLIVKYLARRERAMA